MPYVLRPAKPVKPTPTTPGGYEFIPKPLVDLTKEMLRGGFVKWGREDKLSLEIVNGTTIVPFLAIEDMAEPMPFEERMKRLITFFKDNEGDLLVLAERADAEQADHALAMEKYNEKMSKKKSTRQPRD